MLYLQHRQIGAHWNKSTIHWVQHHSYMTMKVLVCFLLNEEISVRRNLEAATSQFESISDPGDAWLGGSKHPACHIHFLSVHGLYVTGRCTDLGRKGCAIRTKINWYRMSHKFPRSNFCPPQESSQMKYKLHICKSNNYSHLPRTLT